MKKFFKSICNKAREKAESLIVKAETIVEDVKGDLATGTIGASIAGVVVVGLMIAAINAFFPDFFSNMFEAMEDKLGANW